MAQVLTKAWSAALLNALGDILAQKIVDKNEHLDMKRLGIFTFLVTTPTSLCSQCLSEASCECAKCADSAVDGNSGGAVNAKSPLLPRDLTVTPQLQGSE